MTEAAVRSLTRTILEARKGNLYGYAALLIGQCESAAELPHTIRMVLEAVHSALNPVRTTGDQNDSTINSPTK